jgi:hypothetical protein
MRTVCVAELEEWDEEPVARRQAEWDRFRADRRRRGQERECADAEWWERYEKHLRSRRWRWLRSLVVERAGGVCEGCGTARIAQIHHLSYEHMGNEFLFELVGLCAGCHLRVHEE